METNTLILLAIFIAATGFMLWKNEHRKENMVIWLYILAGGIALYSVETADISQPIHLTALEALLVCLIPTLIDSLLSRYKPTIKRPTPKNVKSA